MKKYILSVILLIACLHVHAQSVITNYVYENTYITNNVYTVSNITHVIYEEHEITNIVREYVYYTYYITNNTSYVTNYYHTTNLTFYVTTNIETTVTNNIVDYHYPVYYQTYNYTNIYHNVYVTTNVNYTTNYTTEVTLTNFEGYVEQCQDIITNGVVIVSNATDNAMLYAYIANEAAQRLASTNAVIFATNSIPIPNFTNRMFQLACNNLNGSFMADPIGTQGSEGWQSTSIFAITCEKGSDGKLALMYLSHVSQYTTGFEVCYFPRTIQFIQSGTSYYVIGKLSWRPGLFFTGTTYLYGYYSLCVYEFDLSYNFIKRHEIQGSGPNYPTSSGHYESDISGNGWTGFEGNPITIGGISRSFFRKTSQYNPTYHTIFAPMFPSLDVWKYMWWLTNVTGEHIR